MLFDPPGHPQQRDDGTYVVRSLSEEGRGESLTRIGAQIGREHPFHPPAGVRRFPSHGPDDDGDDGRRHPIEL